MGVDPQDIFRLEEDLRENHHFVDIRHLSASLRTAIQLIVDDLSLQAWMLEMHAQESADFFGGSVKVLAKTKKTQCSEGAWTSLIF